MEFQLPDSFDSLHSSLYQACDNPAATLGTIFSVFRRSEEGFLETNRVFGELYSLVSKCGNYGKEVQKGVEEAIRTALMQLTRYRGNEKEEVIRDALTRLIFLLTEALKNLPSFHSPAIREVLSGVVGFDLPSLWQGRSIDPRFTSLLLSLSISLLSADTYPAELLTWLSSNASQTQWVSWTMRVAQMLFSVKSSGFVSGVVRVVRNKTELAGELLKEVINALEKLEDAEDNDSLRGVSSFLEETASHLPQLFPVFLPTLLQLFDFPSYILRNGLVLSIKSFLKYLVTTNTLEVSVNIEKRTQLYALLEQRTRDKSAYSRAKVVETMKELVAEDCVPIDVYTNCVKIAKERLNDTAALVRKHSGKLLSMLICKDKFEGDQGYKSLPELQDILKSKKTELNSLHSAENDGLIEDEIAKNKGKLELQVGYLELYVQFSSDLQECCGLLYGLLESKCVSDVHTAVETLVVLQAKGVPAAGGAMNRLIPYIWSKDESVRQAITFGFHGLYTNLELVSGKECVDRLVGLYGEMTPGEHSSLADVVKELWRGKLMTGKHWNLVKERYVQKPEAALAFYLGCSSDACREMVIGFYDKFGSLGLAAAPQWNTLREVLSAVTSLGPQGDKSEGLLTLSFKRLCSPSLPFHPSWFPCMLQLLRSAEILSPQSLSMCRYAVIQLSKPLFTSEISEEYLAKCLFVVGEVSLKVLIACDRTKSMIKNTWKPENQQELEMESISGFHEALVAQYVETITEIQENSILECGLIGQVQPLVVRLMRDLRSVKTLWTQQAVLLAFAKFLCVSQVFCQTYLPLLVNVLDDAELPPPLRSNCIITLGDLIHRFPLLLEPYTDRLFPQLHSKAPSIKRISILTLTHLVLNDMLKMRGQLVEIILCLLDPDIRNLAVLFLELLNKKDNSMLYNLIPEAVAKLGSLESLEETQFKLLVDSVVKYVEKEKQQENLIDKLCLRLIGLRKSDEKRRICYCLRALCQSERCLRKLLDNVSTWQVFILQDPGAKSYFDEIRLRLSKSWKSDSKAVLEEYEGRVNGAVDERTHKQGGRG